MADWASLNGQRVVSARVTIPYYGVWVADVLVATDSTILAAATLVLGDLTLVGHAVRQGPYAGSWSARLVGGAGGWRRSVPPQGYVNAGGVSRRMVLQDAAALVGETVSDPTNPAIGTLFNREAAPAARLLRQVAGSIWYVDPSGTTQVGVSRLATAITSDFQVISADPAKGLYRIATEKLADWTPGRTFTSPTVTTPVTVGDLSHVVSDDGTHRVDVMAADAPAGYSASEPSPANRTMRALRELIRGEVPGLTFLGQYEYVVQYATETAVDAVPNSGDSDVLPEIVSAPLLPSILGERVVLAVGSSCTVAFLNGDQSKPVVIAGDYGTPPTLTKLAGGGPKAARVGDQVRITAAQILTAGLTSPAGACTITTDIIATITSGSSKVEVG